MDGLVTSFTREWGLITAAGEISLSLSLSLSLRRLPRYLKDMPLSLAAQDCLTSS